MKRKFVVERETPSPRASRIDVYPGYLDAHIRIYRMQSIYRGIPRSSSRRGRWVDSCCNIRAGRVTGRIMHSSDYTDIIGVAWRIYI